MLHENILVAGLCTFDRLVLLCWGCIIRSNNCKDKWMGACSHHPDVLFSTFSSVSNHRHRLLGLYKALAKDGWRGVTPVFLV